MLWEKMAMFYGYQGAFYTPAELHDAFYDMVHDLEDMQKSEMLKTGEYAHEAFPEIQIEDVFLGLFQKKNWLFFVGLAGICLIFLSDILFGGREGSTGAARQSTQQAVSAATGVQELETRLTEMLESVQGAGKVQVMITLESAGETVYARDEQSDTQTTQDGSDGVTDRKESYKSEHIIVDAADGKQPLVETHIEPEVKGVAVVCEGGDDITVIKRITDLVSVVLGLSTNRICVTKMI